MEKQNDYFDLDSIQKQNPEFQRDDNEGFQREKEKKGYFYSGLIVGLASALLIFSVVYLGTRIQALLNPQQRLVSGLENSVLTEEVLQKFKAIEGIIDKYYYSDDLDFGAMEDGIYRGLLYSIGDDYSEYYSQEELAALMNQTEGIYYGIGAYIGVDEETTLPIISGIIEGAPASEVDLRKEDIIYEVDGESTYGYALNEVVSRIKGEAGTHVVLTIVREGESDVLHVEVERRRVESPTVNFEMLDDTTAYIQIIEFDTVTSDQFAEALAAARASSMTGLVLDLRGNPGGNLSTVVDIARMLLPEGLIVYTEDKYGRRAEYSCDGTRQIEVPMTVLIDGSSASASEILAGAIKDYGVGTLVGTTTFGKGIVQQVVSLDDGSAVKITVSSYFTPKGNNIHGIGIDPDVECKFDVEGYYEEDKIDNQLEKAKEILDGLR